MIVAGGAGAARPPLRCPDCGAEVTADLPLLIVQRDGLIGAIFVPAEATSVADDGAAGAALVRAASAALGRPVITDERALTSAPARLANIVLARDVESDAVAPHLLALDELAPDEAADYRAWIRAIRADVGIAAITAAGTDVLAGETWSEVLATCRSEPRLSSMHARGVIERLSAIVAADADAAGALAIRRRAAFLEDWRARAGDPADIVLDGRHGFEHALSLGARAHLDNYFAGRDGAIDDRIRRLRLALSSAQAGATPAPPVRIALLAGLAAELHDRREEHDLDAALAALEEAIALAMAARGPSSRDVLQLEADHAVVLSDHPAGRADDARATLADIQRRTAAALPAHDPFQATVCLNLGAAWLDEGGSADRGEAQEEGISWLEQALQAVRITPELEVLVSANLAAALRSRLTRRLDDAARADELNRRAVDLARDLHRPGSPERLVGSLAAMANAAAGAGRHDDAVEASREAVAIAAATMPQTHPTRLRAEANGASILHGRAGASREASGADSDADLAEALTRTRATLATMTQTSHPMVRMVEANLAAILADHDSTGSPVDAEEAQRRYGALLRSLDPATDADVLRTSAWNAGTLALAHGRHAEARAAFRVGWDVAQVLADRALLATAQQTQQEWVSRAGRRLAIALMVGSEPDGAEAFAILDASRARLVGGVTERARLALRDPALDPAAREEIARARQALDSQLAAERRTVALRDPPERRREAAALRAMIRDALERIAPMRDEPPSDTPPIPVVHISTERLGTAVAIRYPDGGHGGFLSAGLREERLAALVAADPTELRRALAGALALAGPEVGEPLAVELLGRGHRDAILVPGGPAAAIPWNAVPLRDDAGNVVGTLSDVLGLRLAPAARLLAPPRAPAEPRSPCWLADPDLDAGRWELSEIPRLSGAAPRTTSSVPPWPADTDWLHLSTHGETRARPADGAAPAARRHADARRPARGAPLRPWRDRRRARMPLGAGRPRQLRRGAEHRSRVQRRRGGDRRRGIVGPARPRHRAHRRAHVRAPRGGPAVAPPRGRAAQRAALASRPDGRRAAT